MKTFLREQKSQSTSKLQKKVITILLQNGNKDEVMSYMQDVAQYGCQSGNTPELIYYTDTIAWYKKYQLEINELLQNLIANTGLSINELFTNFDSEDPLCFESNNQNLLAWFSFEEITRQLLNEYENL